MTTLTDKRDLYLRLLPTQQDQYGFIYTDTCDSLLFSCLTGCVPGVDFLPNTAYNLISRQWFRRPYIYPECLQCGGATSTISRDMILGLLWYAWTNKDLWASDSIVEHALNHWCIMGQADNKTDLFGKCFLTPGLLATAAEVSYRLGGKNRWYLRYLPQYESPNVTDYEAHLSVLHQLLRKQLTGSKIKYDHAQRQPGNPLFHIAAGNYDVAQGLLSLSTVWPDARLPTSLDRSDCWVVQRDAGPDWQPGTQQPVKTWSGGDFLFCNWLLETMR